MLREYFCNHVLFPIQSPHYNRLPKILLYYEINELGLFKSHSKIKLCLLIYCRHTNLKIPPNSNNLREHKAYFNYHCNKPVDFSCRRLRVTSFLKMNKLVKGGDYYICHGKRNFSF